MKGLNAVTALVFAITTAHYAQSTFAASGKGKEGTAGTAAGNSGSGNGSTAGAEVRLRAKFEVEAANEAEEDTTPEFHADYRIKKGVPELKVRVENIAAGTVVDVFIQNLKIGSATVEAEEGEGTEASLDFRKGAWPVGLPAALTAGMVVRIFSGNTLLFEAPFAVK